MGVCPATTAQLDLAPLVPSIPQAASLPMKGPGYSTLHLAQSWRLYKRKRLVWHDASVMKLAKANRESDHEGEMENKSRAEDVDNYILDRGCASAVSSDGEVSKWEDWDSCHRNF
jgi:hypothetical protein